MARYYLHLRGGADDVLDLDGSEFASLATLREAVLVAARDVLTNDVRRGVIDLRLRIDAEDGRGAVVHSLPLRLAVAIVGGGPSLPAATDFDRPVVLHLASSSVC